MSLSISKLLESLNIEWVNCLKNLNDKAWNKYTLYKNQTIVALVLSLCNTCQKVLNNHNIDDLEDLHEQFNNQDKFPLIVNMVEQYQMAIITLSLNETVLSNLYSKSWLLQQYIRETINNTDLLTPEYYYPYLHIILRKMPLTYQTVKAFIGATVKIEVVGLENAIWTLEKNAESWILKSENEQNPTALVYIDKNIAWLLFSNGIDLVDAKHYYQIHGDTELASHVFKLRI